MDVKPQSKVLADPLNSEQIQLFFNESSFFFLLSLSVRVDSSASKLLFYYNCIILFFFLAFALFCPFDHGEYFGGEMSNKLCRKYIRLLIQAIGSYGS